MTQKQARIIWNLYCTLTTSQIEKALQQGGITHKEWMQFIEDVTNAKP